MLVFPFWICKSVLYLKENKIVFILKVRYPGKEIQWDCRLKENSGLGHKFSSERDEARCVLQDIVQGEKS